MLITGEIYIYLNCKYYYNDLNDSNYKLTNAIDDNVHVSITRFVGFYISFAIYSSGNLKLLLPGYFEKMVKRSNNYLSSILGFLALLIGSLVLFGWYTENHSLIQIHSTFVPMQYNTALGFLFCGLGLVFLNVEKSTYGRVLGVITSLIGSVTLIQYIFAINVGLDQLFMEHYISVATSHPGRMAPNTALCFLLCGSAFLLHKKNIKNSNDSFTRSIGAIVVGLSLVALLGYLFELESAYGWGNLTRMALHTSVGFIILGLGIICFSFSTLEKKANS